MLLYFCGLVLSLVILTKLLWRVYVYLHSTFFPVREVGTPAHPLPQTGFTVAIVGSGLSGIQSLKQCIADGLSPTCFEADKDIGGLWRFKSDNSFPSVYRSTHIDTGRDLNSFGDRPYSTHEPIVIHNSRVVSYLRENVQEFGLEKYIRFNTRVEFVTPTSDGKQWRVDIVHPTSDTDSTPQKESLIFDGVLICSGRHNRPYMPTDLPGQATFKGSVLHSSEYKDAETHGLGKDSTVAVVGIGNSGCDIVTELAQRVKHCFLVSRSGSWVLDAHGNPLNSLGPNDRLFNTLWSRFPWTVQSTAVERLVQQGRFGDQEYLNDCGLKPGHRLMQAHPTATGIADPEHTLHSEMKHGHISIKKGIQRFVGDYGIVFTEPSGRTSITEKEGGGGGGERGGGGNVEKVDAVIFATGYRQACDFVDPKVVDLRYGREGNDVPLYLYIFPLHENAPQTLGFINFVQAASFLCADLQSRLYTAVVRGEVKLPGEQQRRREVEATRRTLGKQWLDRPRHRIQGALSIKYYDRLAKMIGCYPYFWQILIERPAALRAAWFEPVAALQYRLVGRGKVAKAVEWIAERRKDLRVGQIPNRVPYAITILGLALGVLFMWLRGHYVGPLQWHPADWKQVVEEEIKSSGEEKKTK